MTHSAPAQLDTGLFDALQGAVERAREAGAVVPAPSPDWLRPVLVATGLDRVALERLAYDTHALLRKRGVRCAHHLLTLLMLYVVSDASLRDVAAYGAQMGARLTDEALRQRFHQSEAFVATLLSLLFGANLDRPGTRRVLLVDGTAVQAPGAVGADYRLHTLMELGGAGAVHVELTCGKTAESLLVHDLHCGDLVLGDSAFCLAKELSALVARGVDVLVRFCSQRWPGQPAQGWQDTLLALPPGGLTTFPDTLPKGPPVYIHVLALPEEKAAEARRKKRKSWKKRTGKQPQKLTLLLAGYVMVLTTLPPTQLSAAQALAWYQRRWQIELLFKRQKSLLGLNELRSGRTSALSRVRIWMKLLYSFLVDQGARWDPPLSAQRDKSVWRAWRLAREVLRVQLWLPLLTWRDAEAQVFDALAERPRKRRTQTLTGLLEALQEPTIA